MLISPILPLDIIEMIVDMLAKELDHPEVLASVRALSLVCWAFLPICRKRIFASVVLSNDYAENPFPGEVSTSVFLQSLSSTPEIGQHIRSLQFNIRREDFDDTALVPAFQYLTHLRSLSIYYHILRLERDPEEVWSNGPLRSALHHILQLPTLVSLRVSSAHDSFLEDLPLCANLEDLEFYCRTSAFPTFATPPTSLLRLRSLSVIGSNKHTVKCMCAAKCIDGTPAFDFSGLSSLSVNLLRQEHIDTLLDLIRLCKGLDSIMISVLTASANLSGLSSALRSSRATLKHFHFSIVLRNKEDDDPFYNLSAELEHVGNDETIIEDISIKVHITAHADCNPSSKWGRLDKAFEKPEWALLRRFSLIVGADSAVRKSFFAEEFRASLGIRFPWLSSNKSLLFDLKFNVSPES